MQRYIYSVIQRLIQELGYKMIDRTFSSMYAEYNAADLQMHQERKYQTSCQNFKREKKVIQ